MAGPQLRQPDREELRGQPLTFLEEPEELSFHFICGYMLTFVL